ncbi:CHAT domain-containing protein [Leptolyngbya sp. CCNP1308]|uniref:CHAT domain-containing protein n=1 Tax=Leptolyngbya sp. CCNP1308 TaxID=3110255 RepID=UPI002B203D11|nr:CHAT domain-containing protein [Leptolyngbya sp. CCNP1308]MEA5451785.1 CHAT domain-containing protein [Leptolyngbya sp. CCNP1308]
MKRILILSANPHDTARLRLDQEVRDIDDGLRQSSQRDQFELINQGAVRLRDFRRHMARIKPQIVHFSGHGGGDHGIVLENNDGKAQFLQTEQIAEMFRLFVSKGLECVVLNACYSEVQAKAINQFVPYVIGMNQAIGDKAAIEFAIAFYETLGEGDTVEFSFDLAKSQLIGLKESQKLVLLTNSAVKDQLQQEPAAASETAEKESSDSGISSINLSDSSGTILNPGGKSSITQQFGNTTNINTGGGDYAGGNISK